MSWTRVFLRTSRDAARPVCSASRHIAVSLLTATSVQTPAQRMQCSPKLCVVGRESYGAFELAQRLPQATLSHVNSRKIHIGELPRFVPLRALCPLEPGYSLVELALLHHVAPDVVVRVSELGIDVDSLETLRASLVEPALEAISPAEKGVRLRRRAQLDRALVELDRPVELALHLMPVGLPPDLGRPVECLGPAHALTR